MKQVLHSPLLKTTNLTHSFDYLLYDNVNIEINAQKSVAILGKSGSGKSTLLHNLSTLLKPNNGQVIYKNIDIYSLNDKELATIRREEFGIIFQAHYLFKGFSTIENLQISSIVANKKIDYALLEKLKIQDLVKNSVSTLSGGQQQRVSIARVLVKKPKIIFADEPTGNLDKETANDVMDVLYSYIKENYGALFLVTHDEDLAKRCDKVYRLKNQRLIPCYY